MTKNDQDENIMGALPAGAANPATPGATARNGSIVAPGRFSSTVQDVMVLHAWEALCLFMGRQFNARAPLPVSAGARHFAAAMRAIGLLCANDNPYADWALIRIYDALLALRARIAELTAAREARIAEMRRKGMEIAILQSQAPTRVALGFGSPYGYAAAQTLADFDYYVRLLHTLVRRDAIDNADARHEIAELGQCMAGIFRRAVRWEHRLKRRELASLSRQDFRLPASDDACKRVSAARALLGELPDDVLLRVVRPRHVGTRRAAAIDIDKQHLTRRPHKAGTVAGGKSNAQGSPDSPEQQALTGASRAVSRETLADSTAGAS